MMLRFIWVALMIVPGVSVADSVIDTAKSVFNISKCLMGNTQTMCLFEEMLASNPSEVVEKDTSILGQSKMYIVEAPNSDWRRLWPGQERKEDLVVMHKSGHAFLQVDWLVDSEGGYESIAKAPLNDMAKKLNVEPTNIPIDVSPFKEDGVFYEICYRTNMKTEECMYSAAANMPGGIVKFFSITANEESFVEDIVHLIVSVDIPE